MTKAMKKILIEPAFDEVVVYCTKPNCESTYLNRHHIRHEAMWIYLPVLWFVKQDKLKKEYAQFRPQDISHICVEHHAEIHAMYDVEIAKHKLKLKNKSLVRFTYKEACLLMEDLALIHNIWIRKQTPGMDSALLDQLRGRKGVPEFFKED